MTQPIAVSSSIAEIVFRNNNNDNDIRIQGESVFYTAEAVTRAHLLSAAIILISIPTAVVVVGHANTGSLTGLNFERGSDGPVKPLEAIF